MTDSNLGADLANAMGLPEMGGAQQPIQPATPQAQGGEGNPAEGQNPPLEGEVVAKGDQPIGEGGNAAERAGEGASDGSETAQEQEDALVYVTDLAEELGVDAEVLYGLKFKTDQGEEFTLGEFKDIKQGTAAKSMVDERKKFDEYMDGERKKFMAERDQIMAQTQMAVHAPEEVMALKAEMSGVMRQYQQTDWAALEKQDAGQAANLKMKFQEAYNELEGKLNVASQQAALAQQKQMQEYNLAAEAEFNKRVPEWGDAQVREREFGLIKDVSGHYGFSEQELMQTRDPRLKHLLRDFAVLREQVNAAKQNAKEVVSKPNPVLRRGAIASRRRGGRVDDMVNRAKQTGDKHDQHNAVGALLREAGEI